MPFVTVRTNLAANQLPKCFADKFCSHLANVLDKDPQKMNWTLETRQLLSKGADDPRSPYMQVRVEAVRVFEDPAKTADFHPKIFAFLARETCLAKEEIHVILHHLEPWRIGNNGVAVS